MAYRKTIFKALKVNQAGAMSMQEASADTLSLRANLQVKHLSLADT
jgi:hypothetical protein